MRDGDGWIDCTCGRRHWGLFGAAGVALVRPGGSILLQLRSAVSHEGGTWGLPGGALDAGESPVDGAVRELAEETGLDPFAVRPRAEIVLDHGVWRYTTIVADYVGDPDAPLRMDWESAALEWVPIIEVPDRPLLPAFAASWPRLQPLLGVVSPE